MNMVGHIKHAQKCLDAGVDIICAQGGEGGGHTGDTPTTVLIPAVVEYCRSRKAKSPLTGRPVEIIAAGGIHNGQLLAASLMMGAGAVWVGTRFILTDEAGASHTHKEAVRTAGHDDNIRTMIFSGRPMRVRNNAYINHWETARLQEMEDLLAKGIIPYDVDMDKAIEREESSANSSTGSEEDDPLEPVPRLLMGKCAAVVNEQKSAKAIVDDFVDDAVAWMQRGSRMITKL